LIGTPEPAGEDLSASLPRGARLPINRCNLPAAIIGGLRYQQSPAPLVIDGVRELHRSLFDMLDGMPTPEVRARRFVDYLVVRFRLEALEEAGLSPDFGRLSECRRNPQPRVRANGNYLRAIRGWAFDSDGREGAVLKGWVESRFGLLPRYHAGSLVDTGSEAFARYLEARSAGLYGTNALEAQLDLLYAYTQYELHRPDPDRTHLTLYRGVNRLDAHERVVDKGPSAGVFLLNNLNSFSRSRERACEFGDYILRAEVPLTKVFFYSGLLPGLLGGEEEFAVIGGLYEVSISRY
jgi:NAD+---dinitrogen-reductase ADP-D-ribosyltransferase